jgi:hypothetical protein
MASGAEADSVAAQIVRKSGPEGVRPGEGWPTVRQLRYETWPKGGLGWSAIDTKIKAAFYQKTPYN